MEGRRGSEVSRPREGEPRGAAAARVLLPHLAAILRWQGKDKHVTRQRRSSRAADAEGQTFRRAHRGDSSGGHLLGGDATRRDSVVSVVPIWAGILSIYNIFKHFFFFFKLCDTSRFCKNTELLCLNKSATEIRIVGPLACPTIQFVSIQTLSSLCDVITSLIPLLGKWKELQPGVCWIPWDRRMLELDF